ncbi:MAG TPA: 4-hydroxythreonine-4-phosphate dehydrogenase PdxA [Thermodesulfovibrionales bacterium]|nr:4-hydroxythreonine-4-phosphate dehydrogenase PdxA [Thermodesulfovibrionales bacterium]
MKRLAITAGDPGGIGPEVVVKAVPAVSRECLPVIIGNSGVIEEALSLSGVSLRVREIQDAGEAFPSPGILWCIDPDSGDSFRKGMTAAENGVAAVGCIRKGAALAVEKKVDALVTAPISKEALNLAGFPWPGHTEMLAEFTGTREYAMMLVGGPLKVILVTIHTSLSNVPGLITKENVLRTIRLAKKASDMLGIERPRIAVAGLNPHAGESGILGTEEREAIAPAVEAAKEEGITVEGPYPPDIIFHKAYNGNVDIVVCMYHDQGLIPLKMIAFEKGVNVTVGLRIIRTSPDHGTAYDIAWKGIADPSSMIEAIRMAIRLRLP